MDTKTYTITLVTIENDMIATGTPIVVRGINAAHRTAKRMAGRSAEFIKRGINTAFSGANGTAWIVA